MSFSLARKIGAAFAAALLFTGIISVVGYGTLADSLKTADRVRESQEVLAKLETVTSRLLAAESGGRAYLITRDERYLEPYYTARPAMDRASGELRELLVKDPAQLQRLEVLVPLLAERLAVMERTFAQAKTQRLKPPQQIALINQGSELTERIREIVTALEDAEEAELAQRIAAARVSAQRALTTIVVSNILVVVLLGLAGSIIYGDLTARKKAEAALRDREEQYRRLFEEDLTGNFLATPEGDLLMCNPAFVRLFGFDSSRQALDGNLARLFLEGTDSWQSFRKLLETRHKLENFETVLRRGDGTLIHVLANVAGRFQEHGELREIQGYFFDVSQRKRAEQALRQQRDFAESLIEMEPAIVLLLDPAGRILRFNSYLEELAGYRLEEVRGQDWFTTFVPERDRSQLRDLYQQAGVDTPLRGLVHPLLIRDGRERTVQWFTRRLEGDGDMQAILCLGHDITELKQAQERALQAERLAAIGQMITGLAHESRNALQRSQACLKMLAWQVPDRPRALELVERLQKAQDHLRHLYEGVRGDAAPLRLAPERCHLGEVIQQTWEHLESLREGRHAELVLVPPSHAWHCEADRLSLEQVFRNLLENALAACPDPVVIEVRCAEVVHEGRPGLQLAIRDNGPGLTPAQRQQIFEPFYTTKTHGTGLGLAITKRILEAHHGQIVLGAPSHPGAEFLVTLPREQP